MLVVGLTGGIASGKSTVSTLLKEQGIYIVDADIIAREVVLPGKKAHRLIVQHFGPEILHLDGTLNREALGKVVFGNREKLQLLNSFTHPAVRHEILRRILWAYFHLYSLVVLDVPLLFESRTDIICGLTISVSCAKEVQVERLLARNPELSPDDAQKRISSQMNDTERRKRADIVLENNGSLAQLKEDVKSVIKETKPWWVFTVLDWIPPVAMVSAAVTVGGRWVLGRFKQSQAHGRSE